MRQLWFPLWRPFKCHQGLQTTCCAIRRAFRFQVESLIQKPNGFEWLVARCLKSNNQPEWFYWRFWACCTAACIRPQCPLCLSLSTPYTNQWHCIAWASINDMISSHMQCNLATEASQNFRFWIRHVFLFSMSCLIGPCVLDKIHNNLSVASHEFYNDFKGALGDTSTYKVVPMQATF